MVDKQIIITKLEEIPRDLIMYFKCDGKVFTNKPSGYDPIPGFNEYIEYIKDHKGWKPMKVAKQGRAIIDPAIRSSNINPNNYIHMNNERLRSEKYIYQVDNKLANEILNIGGKNYNIGIGNIQLIRYNTGDHFNEFHQDTLKTSGDCNMIGTMLMFPPADISPFTGGDLVFQETKPDHPELITTTFEPSKLSQWTIVAFGRVMHKCTPVISGVRYVIKAEIWSSFPDIMDPNPHITIDLIMGVIRQQTQPDIIARKNEVLIGKIKEENRKIAAKITDRDPGVKLNDIFDLDGKYNPTSDDAIETFIADYKLAMRSIYLLQKEFNDNLADSKIPSELENTFMMLESNPESYYKTYPLSIYVCSEEYDISTLPDTISTWKAKYLYIIKLILEAGFKITFVNRLFETYKPALLAYERGNGEPEKIESLRFEYNGVYDKINWVFENDREVGKLITTESTYNDESGYDISNTYSSTCIVFFR